MHLASQYLAAAGISFLKKEADDSHTNLGFNTESGCLETHLLSENNDQLSLCYQSFSLIWKSNDDSKTLKLDGTSHKEVLQWLSETSATFLNKPYTYNFHYELPYTIDEDMTFQLKNTAEVTDLMHLRILTHFSLEKIIELYNLDATIRVWPHHFDTGIYAKLPDSSISVGLGLAIADAVSDSYYLYASGYNDEGQITPQNFKAFTKGAWSIDGFKGAVLAAPHLTDDEALEFFKQSIEQYISHSL